MLHVQESEKLVIGEYDHFDVSAKENKGIQEAFVALILKCIH